MTKKCLIITSRVEQPERLSIDPSAYSEVITADAGYLVARRLGIRPTRMIGDFDSAARPGGRDPILLPAEKDMTDTEAALDLAYESGLHDVTILGGLGGRLDHTMGNLGLLRKYLGRIDPLILLDGTNRVFLKGPGSYSVQKDSYQYLGLIAYGGNVAGLTLTGTKYPLEEHLLTPDTTLGVSNEITGSSCRISFREGTLLVIQSNEA